MSQQPTLAVQTGAIRQPVKVGKTRVADLYIPQMAAQVQASIKVLNMQAFDYCNSPLVGVTASFGSSKEFKTLWCG